MTSDAGDKYITIHALEWFGGLWNRFLSWLLDEENGSKRITAIASFILGAVVMRIEPHAFYYATAAAGACIILAFVTSCLIPIALLIEWGLRKVSRR